MALASGMSNRLSNARRSRTATESLGARASASSLRIVGSSFRSRGSMRRGCRPVRESPDAKMPRIRAANCTESRLAAWPGSAPCARGEAITPAGRHTTPTHATRRMRPIREDEPGTVITSLCPGTARRAGERPFLPVALSAKSLSADRLAAVALPCCRRIRESRRRAKRRFVSVRRTG